jgi:hypothetical protein
MSSPYPHLFDDIGFLHRQTQVYTQRRQNSELPENYKYTIEEMAVFLIAEFLLVEKADLSFVHSQAIDSTTWIVNHNLDRWVQVRAKDHLGNGMQGEIIDTSLNSITITFTLAVRGTAYIT